jgi:hypothetical protein
VRSLAGVTELPAARVAEFEALERAGLTRQRGYLSPWLRAYGRASTELRREVDHEVTLWLAGLISGPRMIVSTANLLGVTAFTGRSYTGPLEA